MKEEENNQGQTKNENLTRRADESLARKVVIETDGNRVWVTKNECVGLLEFKSLLREILSNI